MAVAFLGRRFAGIRHLPHGIVAGDWMTAAGFFCGSRTCRGRVVVAVEWRDRKMVGPAPSVGGTVLRCGCLFRGHLPSADWRSGNIAEAGGVGNAVKKPSRTALMRRRRILNRMASAIAKPLVESGLFEDAAVPGGHKAGEADDGNGADGH